TRPSRSASSVVAVTAARPAWPRPPVSVPAGNRDPLPSHGAGSLRSSLRRCWYGHRGPRTRCPIPPIAPAPRKGSPGRWFVRVLAYRQTRQVAIGAGVAPQELALDHLSLASMLRDNQKSREQTRKTRLAVVVHLDERGRAARADLDNLVA